MISLAEQLARCDREIAAMREQTEAPAYLVALGIADWEREKIILQGGPLSASLREVIGVVCSPGADGGLR